MLAATWSPAGKWVGGLVRKRLQFAIRRHAPSLARICAWTFTFTVHLLAFGYVWRVTQTVPQLQGPSALTVAVYLRDEPPPQRPQPEAPSIPTPAAETPAAPTAASRPESIAVAVPEPPPAPVDLPEPVSLSRRIEQTRTEVAAEIAREQAPKRRAFQGRSLDAMLPDAGNGKLPGFRPRTGATPSDAMRGLEKLLSRGVPTAATDPDAPTDLLTEGWEAAHHGSDLAACELQYEELDADLRRQMCGEVRPPE
ncbi:MAG TPA: hypothetical protein VN259_17405 [Xanthomonadales bacterium]|nr:hypothetical protein [Xanthomonadales bacterium]